MKVPAVLRRRAPVRPDPDLRAVFEALSETVAGALRQDCARLAVLGVVNEALPEVVERLVATGQLAYLDGCADAAGEDDGELLDGRARAERAQARADEARAITAPYMDGFKTAAEELRTAAATTLAGFSAFITGRGGDPAAILDAYAAGPLHELAEVTVDAGRATAARDAFGAAVGAAETLGDFRRDVRGEAPVGGAANG